MSDLNYSLPLLRKLMTESPAYQGLAQEEKDTIERHIQNNNKPVLLYVFQQLREEADSIAISRQKLAQKVLNFTPEDQQKLADDLRSGLSNENQ